MKKFLSVFLMLFLIMGIFAGCGDNAESESPHDVIQNPSASEKENDAQEELLPIKTLMSFSEGIAFINRYSEDLKTSSSVYQAIDSTGKVLFEVDVQDMWPKEHEFKVKNGVFIFNETIYDREGKIVASPEKTGYEFLVTDNTYEYILVGKIEQSFEGDMYHFGVLDTKGQWVHPLSKDNLLAKKLNDKNEELGAIKYLGNNTISVGYEEYFNLKNNTLANNYVHVFEEYGVLYKVDENGNENAVMENVDYSSVNGNIEFYRNKDGKTLVFKDGELFADLSQHNFDIDFISITGEDKLLILSKNKSNALYIILINKDGTMAGEPARCEEGFSPTYDSIKNGYLFVKSGSYTHANAKYIDYTGKVTDINGYERVMACGNEFICAYFLQDKEKNIWAYHILNTEGEVVIK